MSNNRIKEAVWFGAILAGRQRVEADMKLAAELKLTATPSILVYKKNGQVFRVQNVTQIEELIK